MPSPLVVTGEDPVALNGSIDGSNDLQIYHGSNSLSAHGQQLQAKHLDLRNSSEQIRVKIIDFSHGGNTWQVSVSHYDSGTVNWTRSTDHAYCDFAAMADYLEVAVIATSNASPPVNKTRTMWVRTMPTDGQ